MRVARRRRPVRMRLAHPSNRPDWPWRPDLWQAAPGSPLAGERRFLGDELLEESAGALVLPER